MTDRSQKFKTIKHYHEPGDLHELTFSCYRRIKLLTNQAIREKLARAIDAAGQKSRIALAAFVFMPEHVHLLTWLQDDQSSIEDYLWEVKRPVSLFQKAQLIAHQSRLLQRLTVSSGADKGLFRMWQEGPGYDRNLQTCEAVQASMDYIHDNPRKRKLIRNPGDWRWSSAKFYATDGLHHDADLPKITPLPGDYWDTRKT